MNTETTEYLDQILAAMREGFDRLEIRLDAIEEHLGSVEKRVGSLEARVESTARRMDDRFVSLEERSRTRELGRRQFETRITDRLDMMGRRLSNLDRLSERRLRGIEERLDGGAWRLGSVEQEVIGVHSRVEALAGDMRQLLRVRDDRVSGLGRRPVA